MGGYYAYFADDDGHITGRVTILASNDEEAKEQAQLLVDGYPVELWQEGRKISTFDPGQPDDGSVLIQVQRRLFGFRIFD